MNPHQMTNEQIIGDIQRMIDKVAEETNGEYKANRLETPSGLYAVDEDENGEMVLTPLENHPMSDGLKRIEVTTNPMSVSEYLLKSAKKKNHNYFESSKPFKPRVKHRAKKAKVRKQKKKW